MRVLLDESLPCKLGFMLTGHFVRTVVQMGWAGLTNGHLLRAAAEQFDVLISGDKNMQYQQNHTTLPILVVTLVAKTNRMGDIAPLVPALMACLDNPGDKRFHCIEEAMG